MYNFHCVRAGCVCNNRVLLGTFTAAQNRQALTALEIITDFVFEVSASIFIFSQIEAFSQVNPLAEDVFDVLLEVKQVSTTISSRNTKIY